MMVVILAVGAIVVLLFTMALMQTAGRCSRAEEAEERRRWEEEQSREEVHQ